MRPSQQMNCSMHVPGFGAFLYSTTTAAMFATVRSDASRLLIHPSGPMRRLLNRLVTMDILPEEETNHALRDGKICIYACSVDIRISCFSLTAYAYMALHMQPALHAVSMNFAIHLSLLSCCWLSASGLLLPRPLQYRIFLFEVTLLFLIAPIRFKLIPSHPASFRSDFVQEYVYDVSTGPYRP